jgi:hypothetical protein
MYAVRFLEWFDAMIWKFLISRRRGAVNAPASLPLSPEKALSLERSSDINLVLDIKLELDMS